MKRGTPERRGATRRRPRAPLASALALELEAVVQAVAAGGACVRLPFAPELGSRHRFTFELEDAAVQVEAIVRNTRKVPGGFEVGIEFDSLSPADQARIEQFVASKLPPV